MAATPAGDRLMSLKPLTRMLERVDVSRDDSDVCLFNDLMLLGELALKLCIAGLIAALKEEKERHRYTACYKLVRADGIGIWTQVLDDILQGVAAAHFCDDASEERRALTQRLGSGTWQHESAECIFRCLQLVNPECEPIAAKVSAVQFLRQFVTLRNKTRGHGAMTAHHYTKISPILERGICLFIDNFSIFNRQWAYVHQNLSGKHRISAMSENAELFAPLKKKTDTLLRNGVYIFYGEPRHVDLVESDPELTDFFVVNGQFNSKGYELLSYSSGNALRRDSSAFLTPIGSLPESETHGLGELDAFDSCFANIPIQHHEYVVRRSLEAELLEAVNSLDQRPVVTLHGGGGVGKTSLALHVAHALSRTDRFSLILWFSARDIDLQPGGAKPVRPQAITVEDVAEQFASMLSPKVQIEKQFVAVNFLSSHLTKSDSDHLGAKLFVFDNFETVSSPFDFYRWIDSHIRLPNKVIITSRYRDFKGDYPIEVRGMEESEFSQLVKNIAQRLHIADLITTLYVDDLFSESAGHPYVAKVLLGEIARHRKVGKVERIMSSLEDILTALFERTYAKLSPGAQRVFLTLCNWRSNVPLIALEAILLQSLEVRLEISDIILELENYSFVETAPDCNGALFISVPPVAAVFGQQKLNVSPFKTMIEGDVRLLQRFGAGQRTDLSKGFAPRAARFFQFVAKECLEDRTTLNKYIPMLECIAQKYPPAWLLLSKLYEEDGSDDHIENAKECLKRFLQIDRGDDCLDQWDKLASLCLGSGDTRGEIHALVELSTREGAPFRKLSYAANRLNSLSRTNHEIDRAEMRALMERLANVMMQRLNEANATDLSRLAWMHLQLDAHEHAHSCAKMGLDMEPNNSHCKNLLDRLTVHPREPNRVERRTASLA